MIETKTDHKIRITAKCFEIPRSSEGVTARDLLEAFSETL